MKTKWKVLITFVVVMAFVFVVQFVVCPRTLRLNLPKDKPDIFVPFGIANKYEDLLSFSFDDFRIWQYKLSEKEKQKINENIENGKLKKATDEELDELSSYYLNSGKNNDFSGNITKSKNVYYCTFKNDLKSTTATFKLGERYMLAYDSDSGVYWWVSRTD